MIERIIKRNGEVEDFSPRKLNGWGEWAAKTLGGDVDWSEVVLHVASTCSAEITSIELQDAFINYCLTKRSFAYNRMAGRLYVAKLYKELYKDKIPTVKEVFSNLVSVGLMSEKFLNSFSDEDYIELEKIINHKQDFNYAHYQIEQAMEKYSLRDRASGKYYESPQFGMLRVAMEMCKNRKNRLERVKRHYKQYSSDVLNVPSPYYMNSGTDRLGLASCCVHDSDDGVPSLATGNHISYMMTVNSAGQGSKIRTRTVNDPVRGGSIPHQGKKPYYRAEVAMINANLQNGRGGAETQSFDVLDPEIEEILVLKNPMTPSARQIRGLDYAMCFTKSFAEKAAKNEDWTLFSYHDCKDLYDAMTLTDGTFETLYEKHLKEGKGRKTVKARDLLRKSLTEAVGVGRIYQTNLWEMNHHTPFKESINLSNLCVAPETKILTREGYQIISELEGENVDVWNGKEWSPVDVVKTGENQKLISVLTSSNQELVCTEYHKWYVQTGYTNSKIVEKRTHELKVGDKLIKFDLPVIEGTETLEHAYTNGFFTGDGCFYGGKQKNYLYHDKQNLVDKMTDVHYKYVDIKQNRTVVHHKGNLKDKYFVPSVKYAVKSKLEWLAGLLDSDGTVARNGTNESLQISSIHLEFLLEVQLMLQTLGVNSKINNHYEVGVRQLPLNDGSGLNGDFHCQESWRLLVSSSGLFKLSQLGLETYRLVWDKRLPQRNAEQFVTVKEVVYEGRFDDTYCVNEPKRHMVMFNGILTGQCQEIALVTNSYNRVDELYISEKINDETLPNAVRDHYRDLTEQVKGEVAVCSLAGINVGKIKGKVGTAEWDAEYAEAAYIALDMIYTGITESQYPLPHIEYTAKKRMSAGVGIVDLAHLLAKYKLTYDSQEGRDLIHKVAESHYYHLLNASLKLSKEFGNAEWMDKTKWVDGWLLIDTYNKHVDEVVTVGLQYDWEGLRKRIIENGGHAFSVLAAHMPAESSSIKSGSTNGVYPIRDLDLNKTNDTNAIKYVVPESDKLGKYYQNAYDISVEDMAKVYGIIQKWTDQAISADQWFKAQGSDKISSTELMKGWFSWVYYGVKTRYYVNTLTAKGVELNVDEVVVEDTSGEWQPEANSDCSGCKL